MIIGPREMGSSARDKRKEGRADNKSSTMLFKTVLLLSALALCSLAGRDSEAHSCHGPHCVAKPTCEPGRLSCREARRIVADLSAKINLYFGQADQEAIATLYSDDCVIIDKQTGSAAYGHAGVIATNSALAQGQPMIWTTSNKTIDLASSHFVLYGHGDLFVQADNATYSGPFKQVLQKYGNDWLLIYEIFDLV
ncbi:hypothetical protein PRIPAC_94462 [Pristionchus pacificus]|uniref:Uncharacterized protein n=1 Tax=Pristionchus pacificus TaxID=54126 RepID=A0A2A6CH53_PRIPA|nr:hypothetical protein PRIPAC_94462 [Pristionchus pacificus]|eukprot:PDM77554.1 hypothetical protein PRIPAC_34421 [Pristionchus pacificus]